MTGCRSEFLPEWISLVWEEVDRIAELSAEGAREGHELLQMS